jgi:hypothetical protein
VSDTNKTWDEVTTGDASRTHGGGH